MQYSAWVRGDRNLLENTAIASDSFSTSDMRTDTLLTEFNRTDGLHHLWNGLKHFKNLIANPDKVALTCSITLIDYCRKVDSC